MSEHPLLSVADSSSFKNEKKNRQPECGIRHWRAIFAKACFKRPDLQDKVCWNLPCKAKNTFKMTFFTNEAS